VYSTNFCFFNHIFFVKITICYRKLGAGFVCFTVIAGCFAAGETLPGVIYSPSNKSDMLSNINQVINFMTERNIRMHVTYPEG